MLLVVSATRLRERIARGFALISMGLVISACGSAGQPNLLMIVVDTLRRDHLGAYGYERDSAPRIDALAAESIRFTRAYSTAPWTQPSVASIITGLYPSAHSTNHLVSFLPKPADTLAEALAGAGYATGAVVSHWILGSRYNFNQGHDVLLQDHAFEKEPFSTPGVSSQAVDLLEGFAREDRPFFLFVHFFDVHSSYQRHPEYGFSDEGAGRLRGGESIKELREFDPPLDPEEIRFIKDAYDEEIRFTDAGVGDLLDALRRLDLDADTLVVFVADHGEAFFDHGLLGHETLHDEVLRVPLLIRLPSSKDRGRVIDEPFSLVSLMPTLLDLLEVDRSNLTFHGPSLVPRLDGNREFTAGALYAEHSKPRQNLFHHALIRGRFKLIVDRTSGERELYDLERDPLEEDDLAQQQPSLAESLAKQLEETSRRVEAVALPRVREIRPGRAGPPPAIVAAPETGGPGGP